MPYKIPTLAEVEALAAKKAPKAARPKPPCKWGPRDENGYCPSKPAADPSVTTSGKPKAPCKWGPRDKNGYCPLKPSRGSLSLGERALEGAIKGAKRGVINAAVDIAFTPGLPAALGREAYAKAIALAGTSVAAAGVGTIAATALAGLAAGYFGTTWIMDRLAEAKEANTPSNRKYQAAIAYRKSREYLAERLGRPITADENKILGQKFKDELAKIGG